MWEPISPVGISSPLAVVPPSTPQSDPYGTDPAEPRHRKTNGHRGTTEPPLSLTRPADRGSDSACAAAVDEVLRACEVAGPVGDEKGHQVPDVAWRAGLTEWDSSDGFDDLLTRCGGADLAGRCVLVGELLGSLGLDESGRDAVHANAVGS